VGVGGGGGGGVGGGGGGGGGWGGGGWGGGRKELWRQAVLQSESVSSAGDVKPSTGKETKGYNKETIKRLKNKSGIRQGGKLKRRAEGGWRRDLERKRITFQQREGRGAPTLGGGRKL